eukprot:364624-Chlamydomonas_euryale.AAC.1
MSSGHMPPKRLTAQPTPLLDRSARAAAAAPPASAVASATRASPAASASAAAAASASISRCWLPSFSACSSFCTDASSAAAARCCCSSASMSPGHMPPKRLPPLLGLVPADPAGASDCAHDRPGDRG